MGKIVTFWMTLGPTIINMSDNLFNWPFCVIIYIITDQGSTQKVKQNRNNSSTLTIPRFTTIIWIYNIIFKLFTFSLGIFL